MLLSDRDTVESGGFPLTQIDPDFFFRGDCINVVPSPTGHVPPGACNSYYNFDPALAPAVAVAVIAGLLMLSHVTLAVISRQKAASLLVLGAVCEFVAFVSLALGSNDQQNLGLATTYQILLFHAPVWINAYVYLAVGHMASNTDPELPPGEGTWLPRFGKIFAWGTAVPIVLQVTGMSMAVPGSHSDRTKTGLSVYTAGLALQLVLLVSFVALMVVFDLRAKRGPAVAAAGIGRLWPLHITLALIAMRTIYRIIEFAGGLTSSNPMLVSQVYSYALDAAPMLLSLLILTTAYPGCCYGRGNRKQPARLLDEDD